MSTGKKIIFFNVAWMRSYTGLRNDTAIGGGAYIKKNKWGHEIFNFSPLKGQVFGYVAAQGDINIDRLGADSSDDFIEGVTVVWTATRPTGGNVIIGWYKNATLYRSMQNQPRAFRNSKILYSVVCPQKKATLLTEDERIFEIPRGKGGFGQRNIWYAFNNKKYVSKVLDYINKGKLPKVRARGVGSSFQVDSLKRRKVEKVAINKICEYYQGLGYRITSVEEEKVGWDLEATKGRTRLMLEVKGLSGDDISVQLTHNEYSQLKKMDNNYRLCVVSKALTNPTLYIFSYSNNEKTWIDEKRNSILKFKELKAARAFV